MAGRGIRTGSASRSRRNPRHSGLMSFTVRGPTRIPAGELREAELTWYSVGERGGIDREPLDGDFHVRVEAKIRAGLRRPVALPDGTKVRAALDDEARPVPC
jgi:hypothetical protein